MSTTSRKDQAPAAACRLAGGSVNFAAAGGRAANAIPIKMVARSPDPIDHWFWGRIVHDFAGMRQHKPTLPCDYIHDEPIGYLNKFSTSSEGLIVEGVLVPTSHPDDRVRQLVELSDGGVPYEASIYFGEEMKAEYVDQGMVTDVNGYKFEGPGVVIREWWLRGVAVCPYGADMNTSSAFASKNARSFAVVAVQRPSLSRTRAAGGARQPLTGMASHIRFAKPTLPHALKKRAPAGASPGAA